MDYGYCDFCHGHHQEPLRFDGDFEDLVDLLMRRMRRDGFTAAQAAQPAESNRVKGLRAMARQDASPNERDIARQKLRDMGLTW